MSAALAQQSRPGAFLGVATLLFAVSAGVTIAWCRSMSDMGEMPMPGGWTLSMSWMRMPGQSWSAAATSFLGMWTVMMVAMMLPSLVPMLWRYREAVGGASASRVQHLGRLTTLVGVSYFVVWVVLGAIVYALGASLAAAAMQLPMLARNIPLAAAVLVLLAGVLQLTTWKAHHLARCRQVPEQLPAEARTAWQHGLRLGFHCSRCGAGLTAVLLVIGVMDLRAMAMVSVATVVERLAPAGKHVARAIGAVAVAAGVFLIARAL